MKIPIRYATDRQRWFLEILLNDCGFGERKQRNAWISGELGREIKFLDQITEPEASDLITKLKEIKEGG